MDFSELIKKLGIEKYPDSLPQIFETQREPLDLSDSFFDKLEDEFSALGARIDDLKLCAEAVKKDSALMEYTRTAVRFLGQAAHHEGHSLALPALDGDSPLYHYPILLLALALPAGIENYRRRGFEDEEIKGMLSAFRGRINSKDKDGKPSNSGYNWLRHYTSAALFNAGLFGVTPRVIDAPIIILKNKNGEYKIMVTNGTYHKSGKPLGNAGYTDEEGSFSAEFSDSQEFYTGHEVIDSSVSKNTSKLKKSELQIIAKQGDWMAVIHIPRGADLSEESMTRGFRDAMAKTLKHYKDLDPKVVHTSTWLLSPKLAELQGKSSGIARFSNRFIKYPIRSGGKELFPFAFPGASENYEELPEGTSLQRKLKALYISGGFIHAHAGFVPDSDTWR
jgi:hypothetical protein